MGSMFGFVGALVLFAGIFLAIFGQGLGFALLSVGLAMLTISGVLNAPGWAFKNAHRMSKPVWLLITFVGLIPPLGLVSFVLWVVCGRGVERAWATGDPASYKGYLARREAARQAGQETNYEAYQRGRRHGRDGW